MVFAAAWIYLQMPTRNAKSDMNSSCFQTFILSDISPQRRRSAFNQIENEVDMYKENMCPKAPKTFLLTLYPFFYAKRNFILTPKNPSTADLVKYILDEP